MLGKTEKNPQLHIAEVPLIHFINPRHELCELARKTDWEKAERDFAAYYSPKGAPSVPIRVMVGLILLKQFYHFGDRSALAQWLENPYWQYFCGEVTFQHKPPFYHGDFSHFRKRIGREGEQKISELGVAVFGASFTTGVSKRKDHSGRPKGIPERLLNRIGNYLLKVSSR
jgi:IS5 family transposase